MKNKFYTYPLFFLAIAAALLPAMGMAQANITLQAPDKAATASAFAAAATSGAPVKSIIFGWNGKEYEARAEQTPAGWQARIMLPVLPDEKAKSRTLTARADNGASARAQIGIVHVKRPVQKLQVDKKYVSPPPEVKARIERDRAKLRAALANGQPDAMWSAPFARPVQGTVSSQFGVKRVFNGQLRGEHKGLDLRGATGTPIRACADGVVVLADDLYYSGNAVYLDHGGGVFSGYLHMSERKAVPGQHVRRGDVIGYVGATGRVTGPHLHLSLLAQGVPVDPLPLLEARQPSQAREVSANGKK